ncbi:DedA family protein [Cryobacterium sp. TMT1-19]|uniref:DedA family protein n=1 Tax=Cryobacterium sp. TMT1-19 TaxID=1259231 RepID=UPI00106ADFC8|nr:DedA family protein [Cryobacterium sp. TMT1-19]TFD38343.1 DedA family protein [Cryobacterium sp. TMT1-19]
MIELLPASTATDGLSGIVGIAADLMANLGEWGVGLFTFAETIFPPIPSEVILPLAGFLSQRGELNFLLVVITSTLGGYVGGLLLYYLGAVIGLERSIYWLSKLPLVDRRDFKKAAGWFSRHGRSAVFFGRFIPGVRSLISLPAGAEHMNLLTFSIFTIAGSALWNVLLIGLGGALGTQYALIDQYSQFLNYAVYAAIGVVIVLLIIRRVQRGTRNDKSIPRSDA